MPYSKIIIMWSLIGFGFLGHHICAQNPKDQKEIYLALADTDSTQVNALIAQYDKATTAGAKAYKGTLLMKKAGMLKKPADKIRAFRKGRILLEGAIKTDSNNVEFRFLRLIIQEQAPEILGYKKNIGEDAAMIRTAFSSLPEDLKNAVRSYSRKSAALPTEQL